MIVETVMLPANPPVPWRSIAVVSCCPASMVRLGGLADIEKSAILTVIWNECVRDPLVPVMVTV